MTPSVYSSKATSVSIIIPNWNGRSLLAKHLPQVIAASPTAEIIVADDMSSDGSVAYVRERFPKVTIVENKKREGFAATVNAGVACASGEIIILLNTDVEPEKAFLSPLLTHFQDPDIFAVGCMDKSMEHGETILRGRGLAHWEKGYFIHTRGEVNAQTTAWVSGGSGAFRKTMWDKLGGMDPLYSPFYWEDIDLSYRARKAGWKTVFEPKSVARHYHEEGKIKKEFAPSNVKRISYRNQFIFIWKNLTDFPLVVAHIFWSPIRMFQALITGDFSMIAGYLGALQRLPIILVHRFNQRHTYRKTDHELNVWD